MQYVIAIAKGENPPKPTFPHTSGDNSNVGRKRPGSPFAGMEPPYKHDNSERYNANR